ncbi:MAG: hypothetical protein HY553_16450 [Elusimicrobia bacterium]|nr:hypothetical protein [Elusimicrobiota bacterium]
MRRLAALLLLAAVEAWPAGGDADLLQPYAVSTAPVKRVGGGPMCVARGTLVETPSGPRPVEFLGVGAELLSVDTATGKARPARVAAVRRKEDAETLRLAFDGGTLDVTAEHPLYDPHARAYRRASAFAAGDRLARREGGSLVPVAVTGVSAGPRGPVFDLTVDGPDRNFVAASVLVHNKGRAIPLDPKAAQAYHRIVSAAVEAVRREGKYAPVDLNDVFLEPSLLDRRVALAVFPRHVRNAPPKPSCWLDADAGGPNLTGALGALAETKRKELLALDAATRRHLTLFMGVLKRAPAFDGSPAPYLEVEDFRDLGEPPPGASPSAADILESPAAMAAAFETAADAARARGRALKADRRWRYVDVDALADELERYVGRRVSTFGHKTLYLASRPPLLRLSGDDLQPTVQVTLPGASPEDLRRLMRRPAHHRKLVVRGEVRRAPNGAAYLEARSFEDLGTSLPVKDILNPSPDRIEIGPGMVVQRATWTLTAGDRDAYRRRALETLDRFRAAGRYRIVDWEDLVLTRPSSRAGERVVTIGIPWENAKGLRGAFCTIGNDGADPQLPVRLANLAARQQSDFYRVRFHSRLVVVAGVVALEDGRGYLEAEELVDLGEFPVGVAAPAYELLEPAPPQPPDPGGETLRRRMAAFAGDPEFQYFRFEDLVVAPKRYLDKNVSVLGAAGELEPITKRFKLQSSFAGQNFLWASMEHLPAGDQKLIVRAMFPPRTLGVKARVRQAPNGAVWLDVQAVSDFGKDRPDLINSFR